MENANFTPQQKAELVNRVRSEVQQQALQELTQNLQEKCFDKCISRPHGKLDGKQQNCLALCINRYIDTMKVVSEAMVQRGPQGGECRILIFDINNVDLPSQSLKFICKTTTDQDESVVKPTTTDSISDTSKV